MKEYKIKTEGNEYTVAIESAADGKACVIVNGKSYEVEYSSPAAEEPAANAPVVHVTSVKQTAPATGAKVTSPLPGVIVDICVSVGDKVSGGQKIAVLEAMKMENEIQAPCSGTVKEIRAAKGDSVPEGETLIIIG